MLAGVEVSLLVVPVCILIIGWSYCQVVPKDGNTFAVNGTLVGVQIFRFIFPMMRDIEKFGKVVCCVVCTCSPLNLELVLAFTVLEPLVVHVNGFGWRCFMVWLAMPTAVELSQVTGVGGWGRPISSSAMRIGIASILL